MRALLCVALLMGLFVSDADAARRRGRLFKGRQQRQKQSCGPQGCMAQLDCNPRYVALKPPGEGWTDRVSPDGVRTWVRPIPRDKDGRFIEPEPQPGEVHAVIGPVGDGEPVDIPIPGADTIVPKVDSETKVEPGKWYDTGIAVEKYVDPKAAKRQPGEPKPPDYVPATFPDWLSDKFDAPPSRVKGGIDFGGYVGHPGPKGTWLIRTRVNGDIGITIKTDKRFTDEELRSLKGHGGRQSVVHPPKQVEELPVPGPVDDE